MIYRHVDHCGKASDPHRLRARLYSPRVIAYADYVACNGEQGAKEAGMMKLEGKDYVVRDGDVVHFRFNV